MHKMAKPVWAADPLRSLAGVQGDEVQQLALLLCEFLCRLWALNRVGVASGRWSRLELDLWV